MVVFKTNGAVHARIFFRLLLILLRLVFLGGMTVDEGQKAAGIVIVLLWRIARVVDGLAQRCYVVI